MELQTVHISRNDKGLGIKFDQNNVVAELVARAAGALHGGISIGDRLVAVAGRHVFAREPLAPHFPPGDAPIELSFLRKAAAPAHTPMPSPPAPETCWRCRFEPRWRPDEELRAAGGLQGRTNGVATAAERAADGGGSTEEATEGGSTGVGNEATEWQGMAAGEADADAGNGVADDDADVPAWLLEAAEQLERLLPPTPSSSGVSPAVGSPTATCASAAASPATPSTPTLRVDAATSTAATSSSGGRVAGRPAAAVVQAAQLMDIAAAGLPAGWCLGWSATYRRERPHRAALPFSHTHTHTHTHTPPRARKHSAAARASRPTDLLACPPSGGWRRNLCFLLRRAP